MALDALLALRDQIANDAGLNNFFVTHYNKAAKHIVGYKRSQNVNDYPCLCYVPVSSQTEGVNDRLKVSVIIGINEPIVTDDIMQGHIRLNETVALLEPIINLGTLSDRAIVFPDYQLIYDFGERHPFYELEVQLKLIWRRHPWV